MTHFRFQLALIAAFGFVAAASGQQQLADPKFDAKVAKPAYADKAPKVLFDEAHANFHTSTGRYKPFADLIANDGYRVTAGKDKFDKKSLEGFNVLVIANAAPGKGKDAAAFTKEECDAVHDWVSAGGALLLIADHAPFGTAAESLATRFGVEMSKGYTHDKANFEKAGGDSWLVFSGENKLLGDHAITKGRDDKEKVGRVVTFTGQSLKGPDGSVAFLKLSESATDRLPPDFKKTAPATGRAQGVAFEVGKGRVVVLGEAAMLSAQIFVDADKTKEPRKMGMNFPDTDNRQLALNLMHWLSGLTE